jgi:hypothetical protein
MVEDFEMGKVAYRAASNFVGLAVVVLIIRSLAVAVHGHDVGEDGAWSVVLVGIKEETESLKLVRVAKHIAWLPALLCEPHCEAVAVEVALALDLELEFNLLA